MAVILYELLKPVKTGQWKAKKMQMPEKDAAKSLMTLAFYHFHSDFLIIFLPPPGTDRHKSSNNGGPNQKGNTSAPAAP